MITKLWTALKAAAREFKRVINGGGGGGPQEPL